MAIKIPLFNSYVGSVPPTNPVNGTMWIDTSTQPPQFKVFIGGTWTVPFTVGPHTHNISDITGLESFVSSGKVNVSLVSQNIVLDETHTVVLVDATQGNITVGLPNVSDFVKKTFVIKKADTSPNEVIIVPQQGETIDGENGIALQEPNQFLALVGSQDGSWKIIGR